MSLPDDPDARALLYVQQYLAEQGYTDALREVERRSGLLYDSDKCPTGSCLLQLVYKELEQQFADSYDAAEAARQLERQWLLQGGLDDYPCQPYATLRDQHSANILVVRWVPGGHQVVTGSADGCVRCFQLPSHTQRWATTVPAAGGILTLALAHQQKQQQQQEQQQQQQEEGNSPRPAAASPHSSSSSSAPGLIAVGCMNGSVAVLDSSTGAMLGSCKPHSKYVVAVAWSHCGQHLATASYDHSWTIQSVAVSGEGAAGCSRAAAPDAATTTATTSSSSGGAAAQSGDRVQFRMIRQVPFTANVQDVQFLPPSLSAPAAPATTGASPASAAAPAAAAAASRGGGAGSGVDGASREGSNTGSGGSSGVLLLAAVRGASCLYCYKAATGEEVAQIPLDEEQRGAVPYSVMKMVLSPDTRYLLLATDGPRLVVLRTQDWTQLGLIHGLVTEQFHVPAVCWGRDSHYLFTNAAGASILVFHLGSGKQVAKIAGQHKVNVRDIDFDPVSNQLVSCSFDRSLVFYNRPQQQQQQQ